MTQVSGRRRARHEHGDPFRRLPVRRSISSTRHCVTGSRRPASISRSRTRSRLRIGCSTSSASTMSRAAIPAPIRPTPPFSSASARRQRIVRRLRHDQAGRASRSNDPGVAALNGSKSDAVCYVAKAGTTMCASRSAAPTRKTSSRFASRSRRVAAGKEAMVDCEHFFDGYKANPAYALACAKDGPRGRRALDRAVRHQWRHPAARDPRHRRRHGDRRRNPGRPARHPCPQRHRQAVANSLAAVDAGVRQVQGTLNGIGERCGNANLVTLIPTLMLKPAFSDRFEIGHRAGKTGWS
jgi:2-isopropylmalate synthase